MPFVTVLAKGTSSFRNQCKQPEIGCHDFLKLHTSDPHLCVTPCKDIMITILYDTVHKDVVGG